MNEYSAYTSAGIQTLQQWYDPDSGQWQSTGWWNAANALWVLIDYAVRANEPAYLDTVRWTFQKHRRGGFLNNFYDDEGWWALTWIKAYDATGNQHYLVTAQMIYADMETGWDDICGGGIWWSKERSYKNAIANELFLTVGARLQRRATTEEEQSYYWQRAQETWHWFAQSGMINSQYLVNDGLRNCTNNGGPTWTYNQGVIIGGLVELYHITHDQSYLAPATAIADATITTLVNVNGILQEPCEQNNDCGADGPQFKGIFARNLAHLLEVVPKESYRNFLLTNARAIVTNNRNELHQYGLHWNGPIDSTDAARQSSALDVLNIAMSLSEAPLMNNLNDGKSAADGNVTH
jgi:Predicted glycosyl hydrolase